MGDSRYIISLSQPYKVLVLLVPFTHQETKAQKAKLWSRSHWLHVQTGTGFQSLELYLPLNLSILLRTPRHTHTPKANCGVLLLYYYEVWNLNFPTEYKKESLSESLTNKKNY